MSFTGAGSPADLGFELMPPDPGMISPDLALEAALMPVVELDEPAPPPLGRGWSFDFTSGHFYRQGLAPAKVYGIDQLRMWIEKALRTSRYAHTIYSDEYGMVEPLQLIGQPPDGNLIAAYEEGITEALLVHESIASVDGFDYQHDELDDLLYVSFTVTLEQQVEPSAEQPLTIQVSDVPLGSAQ